MDERRSVVQVAGMAGEGQLEALTGFLSRLMGSQVAPDEPLALRSIHRAALAAWCRRQTPPVHLGGFVPGSVQTPASMLSGTEPRPAAATQPGANASPPLASAPGLGIDIEDVASMPDAQDFRRHPFYKDQFTDAEISHAIRATNARSTLCGIWAAKEAVIKAGLSRARGGLLRDVEITWTDDGRPLFPGATLSISHTPTTAVAVCIVAPSTTAAAPTLPPIIAAAEPTPPPRQKARRIRAALTWLGAGLVVTGVFTAWQVMS